MYKSKFKIFGQTGLIVILLTFVVIMTLWTAIDYENLDHKDKLFMRLGWPSSGFLILFLGHKVFFEMNQISIDDKKVLIRNFISRRTIEINKQELKGYKDKFFNGYSLLLIDQSDKVIAKMSDPYYKDFKTLRDNLGLTYLGRVPTFWDRIIGIVKMEDEK